MNSETTKKCSKCGCDKFLKFFKVRESTGKYYKTCMKCCEKGSGNKKCSCGKIPSFGFEGDKRPTCCSSCKQDGMIDIKHKKCKSDHCDIRANNKKYRGYCSRCFFFTYPDEKLTRNYKTKENTIVDHIKQKFPEYDWVHDRKVLDGCSLKRPDLYCDFGNHILVVEVDENSHKGYNCEEKRMFTIINDLGMRPTIFVRINPDKYTDEKTNKVIQSPFVIKKDTGKLEVKNQKELNLRLDSLCDTIKKYSEEKEYKIFNLEELFFC